MKQFKLPKEFAEKWLTALRSGEYIQGESMLMTYIDDYEGELKENCRYCCLGVAAHIAGIKNDKLLTEYIPDNNITPKEIVGSVEQLPSLLSQLNDGINKIDYDEFMEINEYEPFLFRHFDIYQEFTVKEEIKLTFNQIADFIEDNCEFYEKETIKN